jgi:hypothetical protein
MRHMNSFSGDTRVTLTAAGWLLMAQEALAGIEQTSNNTQSAQLRSKAKRSLFLAVGALDSERPSGHPRRPSNLARISQGASK